MSPLKKLQLANNLYWTPWEAKKAWFRQTNPVLTDEQIEEKVREVFIHATT